MRSLYQVLAAFGVEEPVGDHRYCCLLLCCLKQELAMHPQLPPCCLDAVVKSGGFDGHWHPPRSIRGKMNNRSGTTLDSAELVAVVD